MLSQKQFTFIKKKLRKLWFEMLFFSFSLIISLTVLIIYFSEKKNQEKNVIEIKQTLPEKKEESIFVDISGAVEKPDVYEVTPGARLKDVLIIAGGLSADADRYFFARNFNLARFVSDQEKIHIPSVYEINSGLFTETSRLIDYVSPVEGNKKVTSEQSSKININQASLEELDQLPGVGKATAKKIIDNRPYSKIEDLINKKVVNKSSFEKIKDLVEI